MSAVERLRRSFHESPNGCWEWQRYLGNRGYGYFGLNGRVLYAHRASYELLVGPIPEGLQLDHLCRNPRCVNPAHLEPVTNAENMRRRKEANSHCKRGHELAPGNLYWANPKGYMTRRCRECVLLRRHGLLDAEVDS